jgi:hypothetical protein
VCKVWSESISLNPTHSDFREDLDREFTPEDKRLGMFIIDACTEYTELDRENNAFWASCDYKDQIALNRLMSRIVFGGSK